MLTFSTFKNRTRCITKKQEKKHDRRFAPEKKAQNKPVDISGQGGRKREKKSLPAHSAHNAKKKSYAVAQNDTLFAQQPPTLEYCSM